MSLKVVPTKGNLIATKKSLELATNGFYLLDKKRNVLIKEMSSLIDEVRILRNKITIGYQEAYQALQEANISLGIITDLASATPVDTGIQVAYRSVMGVEIPKVDYSNIYNGRLYDFERTNSKVDHAYHCFTVVKELTIVLAQTENSVCRLANAIVKTQKRANALANVTIVDLEQTVKIITDALEEKEREEFTRQKVIKESM